MPAPSTAKALVLPTKQGSLVIRDVEVAKPAAGEILVKILATGLNPVDWKIHKWAFAFNDDSDYPAIIGNDFGGEVVEIGEGVMDFRIGDNVFGQGQFKPDRGTFQQYIIGLASTTSKIPPNVSVDEVATIPVVLTAAYVGLYNKPPYGLGIDLPLLLSDATEAKYAGTPILIFGGSSSVGQMVLQLSRISGFSPIITTASLGKTGLLKSLGATIVLDRNLPLSDLIEEVQKLSPKPLKYIYDAISSAETQKTSLSLLADGGKVIVVTPPFVINSTETKTVIRVAGILTAPQNVELLKTLYHDKVYDLIAKGLIKPNKVEVLPNGLAGIPAGLDRLEADTVSGLKLVARPHETA